VPVIIPTCRLASRCQCTHSSAQWIYNLDSSVWVFLYHQDLCDSW